MLTDLKVSSLACNCLFHRPEHNKGLETQKEKMKKKKNGIICLVIMFTPRVIVIQMSKTETSKNKKLSDVFRGYKKETYA